MGCHYYYNSTPTEYEFTAFTEEDLLGDSNGSSIGCGDTFVMPECATVSFTVLDDDSRLSGDNRNNEQGNDRSYQDADIVGADGEVIASSAGIYYERYHVLHGSDGKCYFLIEIESPDADAPGTGDDFFTFYGAIPPAGVELTVAGTYNDCGGLKYDYLGGGELCDDAAAINVYNYAFMMETSDAMVTPVTFLDADNDLTSGGVDDTRLEVAKNGILDLIDQMVAELSGEAAVVNIGLITFSSAGTGSETVTITFGDGDDSDIAAAIAAVEAINDTPDEGDTVDLNAGLQAGADWFDSMGDGTDEFAFVFTEGASTGGPANDETDFATGLGALEAAMAPDEVDETTIQVAAIAGPSQFGQIFGGTDETIVDVLDEIDSGAGVAGTGPVEAWDNEDDPLGAFFPLPGLDGELLLGL